MEAETKMTTIHAVYQGGVLRPMQPLTLAEGEVVEVTVVPARIRPMQLPPPTPEEEEYIQRLKAAKTIDELFAVASTAPPSPEGYDLCAALQANRAATGERLPYPPGGKETP